ncbi:MAG: serine/threonine protein kinase [Chloroflexi bacterium]|nr:serine/threonine protein kinase [Chloroflexota bacterium]
MGVTKPLSQLNPGQRLGPYTIERLIGRGRLSEVYRAARTGAPEPVALKVFLPGVIRGPAHAARFLNDIARIAQLTHPNITRILDFGTDPTKDLSYIAMECFEGTTLRDEIAAHPSGYPRDELWRRFEPVANAVTHAHDNQQVHGSIRPDHIVIASGSRPVLTDFSLVSLTGQGLPGRDAPPSAVAYWAPEQAAQLAPGPAADIYALGVLLYEMAVGDVPFKGRTRDALVTQHLYEAPTPPSQRRAGLDPRVERAILIALHKNPAERFVSVREMLAVMSSAGSDDYATLNLDKQLAREVRRRSAPPPAVRVPRAEPPTPEPESAPAALPPSPNRRAWGWVLVALLLAVALVIALL